MVTRFRNCLKKFQKWNKSCSVLEKNQDLTDVYLLLSENWRMLWKEKNTFTCFGIFHSFSKELFRGKTIQQHLLLPAFFKSEFNGWTSPCSVFPEWKQTAIKKPGLPGLTLVSLLTKKGQKKQNPQKRKVSLKIKNFAWFSIQHFSISFQKQRHLWAIFQTFTWNKSIGTASAVFPNFSHWCVPDLLVRRNILTKRFEIRPIGLFSIKFVALTADQQYRQFHTTAEKFLLI